MWKSKSSDSTFIQFNESIMNSPSGKAKKQNTFQNVPVKPQTHQFVPICTSASTYIAVRACCCCKHFERRKNIYNSSFQLGRNNLLYNLYCYVNVAELFRGILISNKFPINWIHNKQKIFSLQRTIPFDRNCRFNRKKKYSGAIT